MSRAYALLFLLCFFVFQNSAKAFTEKANAVDVRFESEDRDSNSWTVEYKDGRKVKMSQQEFTTSREQHYSRFFAFQLKPNKDNFEVLREDVKVNIAQIAMTDYGPNDPKDPRRTLSTLIGKSYFESLPASDQSLIAYESLKILAPPTFTNDKGTYKEMSEAYFQQVALLIRHASTSGQEKFQKQVCDLTQVLTYDPPPKEGGFTEKNFQTHYIKLFSRLLEISEPFKRERFLTCPSKDEKSTYVVADLIASFKKYLPKGSVKISPPDRSGIYSFSLCTQEQIKKYFGQTVDHLKEFKFEVNHYIIANEGPCHINGVLNKSQANDFTYQARRMLEPAPPPKVKFLTIDELVAKLGIIVHKDVQPSTAPYMDLKTPPPPK